MAKIIALDNATLIDIDDFLEQCISSLIEEIIESHKGTDLSEEDRQSIMLILKMAHSAASYMLVQYREHYGIETLKEEHDSK